MSTDDGIHERSVHDGAGELDALAREELRLTFEAQIERIQEIDNKAIEILKANLLVMGVFVTGISILIQSGIAVDAFVNLYTVFAGLLVLASTALAGVTYTSSNLIGGVDETALDRTGHAAGAFGEDLAESYSRWIAYNAEVTAVNDILITVTVLLVIDAFLFLVGGIAVAVLAPPQWLVVVSFLIVTAIVGWTTRLVYYMDHIDSTGGPSAPFAGVRLSKGGSRREGHSALRRMLTSADESRPDGTVDDRRPTGDDHDRFR